MWTTDGISGYTIHVIDGSGRRTMILTKVMNGVEGERMEEVRGRVRGSLVEIMIN